MAARSLGLAATLGLAANAFLLPPDVSTETINTDSSLDEAWTILNPQAQPLLVPCTGCETGEAGEKNLFLNFSVGPKPGMLELGGAPFYPPSAYMQSDMTSEPSGLAVPAGKSMADAIAEPEQYAGVPVQGLIVAVHKADTLPEHGRELLELTVTINVVNDNEVHIPRIKLNVLNDSDRLTILSTGYVADDAPSDLKVGHQEEKPKCESALCQWRQFIEDKVHGISAAAHKQFGNGRPCPGKMREMMKDGKMPHGGPFTNMHHGPGSHHHRPLGEAGRPHHHHGHPKLHHGHRHRHHGFHGFFHSVGRFIMAVAIPILIGVAAGVLTYAIGMVVGMVIALIWIKVFRGGKRGYASVALTEDDAVIKEMGADTEPRESFESAPPLYEDAPAYEEKQVA